MGKLGQDLRFALRLLWKDRLFAGTAVLTLTICIGANAALFSVVHSVLLRPLPYPDADRLVTVYDAFPGAGVPRAGTSIPNYLDRLAQTDVFEAQATYGFQGLNVGEGATAERVRAMVATPSLFQVVKVEPFAGRLFTPDEGEPGNDHRVLLSHGYWQRVLASSQSAIGRDLRVNGRPYTIVGVMPPGFAFLDDGVQLWIPRSFTPEERSEERRYSQNDGQVGRLKPGASIERAQQQVDAINARNLEKAGPLKALLINAGFHSVVVPLQQDLVRNARGIIYLLWGGVLFVLLIAAVNVANLVLVRAHGRARELATRQVLGAGRWRMVLQLVAETTLMTVLGGVLGVLVGAWFLGWLSSAGLAELPRGHEIEMDRVVVGFTFGLAFILGLAIGAVPLAQLGGLNLGQFLREDSRTSTASPGARLLRRTLATAQVGIAFVLLIGAGLLLSSFQRLAAIDPGFNPSHVLTGLVEPPSVRYGDDAALRSFADRLLEKVRALPGVEAAGVTSSLPFSGSTSSSVIIAEGYVMAPGESLISPNQTRATPGYFEAMGVPRLSGRYFDATDTADAPGVVIVDDRLARKFWPNADPIGRRMYMPDSPKEVTAPGPNTRWLRVVGVVGTVKQVGLVEGEGARLGAYYFPFAQDPSRSIGLAIRTAGNPVQVTAAVRRVLGDLDPELPLYDVQPMPDRVERSLDRRRTPMLLAIGFAAVALLLAAVGIYGVLAYQVAQRTREIGLRIALGSSRLDVLMLVLREGVTIVGLGLAIGLAAVVALRRLLETQLYGVGALDPAVLVLVLLVLGFVALVACLLPAGRATRIDPIVALTAN